MTGRTGTLAAELARYHEVYGENVLVVDTRGPPLHNAGVDTAAPEVARAVDAARRNQPPDPVERLTPWSAPTLLIARPVGTGPAGERCGRDRCVHRPRPRRHHPVLVVDHGGGARSAMALFTALALTLSQWVLRPLAALARCGRRISTAQLPKPRATATDASIVDPRTAGRPRSGRSPSRSTRWRSRSSIRPTRSASWSPTPRMRCATRSPRCPSGSTRSSRRSGRRGRATFAGATAEVERLTALLDGLLALAVAESVSEFDPARTSPREGEVCDAVQVVADRFDAWNSAFVAAEVTLYRRARPDTRRDDRVRRCPRADPRRPVEQFLPLRRRGRAHPDRPVETVGEWVDVRVSDDGVGVRRGRARPAHHPLLPRRGRRRGAGGSGLGLPIAAALTASQHGAREIERVDPHGLSR